MGTLSLRAFIAYVVVTFVSARKYLLQRDGLIVKK